MAPLVAEVVGRAAELAVLDELLEGLSGEPRALSIVGGPGIGKSRLLAELEVRANRLGYLVLSGSASELERDLPFGPFVDAIDDYLAGLDPHRLSRLEDEVMVELARLFPALASDRHSDATALQHERYRSHRAVRALLETLATKPLVLLLDDFHWADGASVELAGALLRRPPAAPVMVVLAARARRRSHDLFENELARAEQIGTLVRVGLEPLSVDEAGALLGGAVPRAMVERLHEESGGVPFYLEQLARVDGDGQRAAAINGSASLVDGQVPIAVVAALEEELALLAGATRRVLEGAAVAGDPFEPELAAAAAGIDEADAVDALDELLRQEFVRPTDVPRRFRFRHPLVRRAVYEGSPAGWRLGAHERTAAALAERGAAAAARAPHVERSARQGDTEAIELLREAGDLAAGRAPTTAARFYDAAVRLLADNAPAEQRAELLMLRGNMLAAVGRLGEGHAAFEAAVALTADAEPALRARATLACAAVERLLGRNYDATTRLLAAREAIPEGSSESVALAIDLAFDGFYRLEFSAMREWAVRAVEEADRLGDPPLRASAHAMLALAGSWMSDMGAAESALEDAIPIVDGLSDAELSKRLDAAASLAAAELYLDRFSDAQRHAERTLALARATSQGHMLPSVNAILTTCWSMNGQLDDAVALLNGALDAARLLDDPQGLAWVLLNRSSVLLKAGDVENALADATESVDLAKGLDAGLISAWAGIRLAIAMLAAGDAAGAIPMMKASAGGDLLEKIPGGWRVACLEALTQAQIELGLLDEARRTVAAAEAWSAPLGLPLGLAMSHVARARLCLATGEPEQAVASARASMDAAAPAGAAFEAAVSRIVLGRALAQAGDRDQAVKELTGAAADLQRFGAVRQVKAAEQELRRLGQHIHRRTKSGTAGAGGMQSLTERELEIARLAADRLTNREIAERLFLSQKTVETHMRNLFMKLGVSSRVQVARAVEQAKPR